jgi:hypothetical protein
VALPKAFCSNFEVLMSVVYACERCEARTVFQILKIHTLPDESPPVEYSFTRCEKCNKPALFVREDMGDGFDNDSFYRVFPAHKRHLGFLMPALVRTSYEEAVLCENAKAYTGCVVLVGRTLEAVCKDSAPKERTLARALKAMLAAGALSQEVYDWASELRVIRNYGAHATEEKIDWQDAREALDFLQVILELMYELRPKFQQFRNRRKKLPPF